MKKLTGKLLKKTVFPPLLLRTLNCLHLIGRKGCRQYGKCHRIATYKALSVVILILYRAPFGHTVPIDHWETVVFDNDLWKYYVAKSEPDVSWRKLSFDDNTWSQGPGGIGYGDDDDNTVVESCVSLYLRLKFTILDTSRIESAILHVDYDDAFVAYINNREIARAGISGDPPAYNRSANTDHEAQMYQGGLPEAFVIDRTKLKSCLNQGENVLAVQIHNTSITSSDLSSATFLSLGINDATHLYRPTPEWFEEPLVFSSSILPIIIITTKNGASIPDEPKIPANMKIIHYGSINHVTDVANIYDGDVGIEIRGRYSAGLPQKPYGFETRDASGNNLNVPLLNMPPENDWMLLANYNDKTFMRNSLAFYLFREMGHYAPRTQHCEVMVNDNYQGVYVFCEKIKRDNNRVNIAVLDSSENTGDDLTGGYIFKIDYYDASNSWVSHYSPTGERGGDVHFVYEYPKPEDITNRQKIYIREFVDALESALYGENFRDPIKGYRAYLDVNSFIDYFIIGELSRNVDAYKKSAYFYKDRESNGGRLHAGPVWDFDWAWKNINECYFGARDGSGWAYKVHDCGNWPVPPGWTLKLIQDPEFTRKLSARYFSLRKTVLKETYLNSYIDSVSTLVEDAQKRHYDKWRILGVNVGTPETDSQPTTYAGEIAKFKEWIATRLTWLDANLNQALAVENVTRSYILYENYPNPFNSTTNISYTLPASKSVTLEIYNKIGRHVRTLVHEMQTEGDYSIVFNACGLSSGLYFYRLRAGSDFMETKKMLLLK
jgi:hypothetical protein